MRLRRTACSIVRTAIDLTDYSHHSAPLSCARASIAAKPTMASSGTDSQGFLLRAQARRAMVTEALKLQGLEDSEKDRNIYPNTADTEQTLTAEGTLTTGLRYKAFAFDTWVVGTHSVRDLVASVFEDGTLTISGKLTSTDQNHAAHNTQMIATLLHHSVGGAGALEEVACYKEAGKPSSGCYDWYYTALDEAVLVRGTYQTKHFPDVARVHLHTAYRYTVLRT
jgi:hypothetical protein